MRHRIAGTKLKREPEHRNMLLRNLATSVLEHGRITTTLAKAKATQPVVEQLITLAKGGWDLNKFRRVLTVVTKKDVAWRFSKNIRTLTRKLRRPSAPGSQIAMVDTPVSTNLPKCVRVIAHKWPSSACLAKMKPFQPPRRLHQSLLLNNF